MPGLWLASIFFFAVNCWILGVVVADIGSNAVIIDKTVPVKEAQ